MVDTAQVVSHDVAAEVRAWLADNWDPDLTVAEWWDRLGHSGWAAPTWPEEWFGKGLARDDAGRVQRAITEFGALGPPGGLGLMLAGPTIATHGTDDQKRRYLEAIVTGRQAWCQLFSEPGAGSDLAGLQARATKDGEEWIVNGQKVWTSGGQIADLGMLVARTDQDVPKHQGITYFALDMHQAGVEVRPLREMTGRALFNEVFLSDARVADDAVIGGVNHGWAVANTTLTFERASLGAGGGSAAAAARPGSVAGDLTRRAGDFVRPASGSPAPSGPLFAEAERIFIDLAKDNGAIADANVRQDLMRLHSYNEIGRFTTLRQKALRAAGSELSGAGNMAKLSMSRIVRLSRDLGLRILGPLGTLHGYDSVGRQGLEAATGNRWLSTVTELALFSPAPSIYGGTDEVQRNIIGERVLGLPKEPNSDRVTPFRDLAKNG
jgi:alkylation response protein AidB-like acyl-CoA dehydrogenase